MLGIESKIKIIPITQPFLRTLAHHIHRSFPDKSSDFSDLLVVFPTQRNKLYFRRYLLDVTGMRGVLPPALKTIGELIDMLYEDSGGKKGLMLNAIERTFVLKSVVDSLKVEFWSDVPFLRFISLGSRLLQFFDELCEEGMSLDEIEEKIHMGHYPEQYVENELSIIKKIYTEYRKAIQRLGYCDSIDKSLSLRASCSTEGLSRYAHIAIAGVVAATDLEVRILTKLLADHPSELILHSTDADVMAMSDIASPFYQHRKLLRYLEVADDKPIQILGESGKDVPRILVRRVETLTQQSLFIGEQMRQLKNKYELHRIGIILADEQIVYSITEGLRNAGVEYNLSVGLPFTRSLLFTFLKILKDMVESTQHVTEVFALLKHPLIKNAVVGGKAIRPLVYQLEKKMISEQLNYLRFEGFDEYYEPLLGFIKQCSEVVQQSVPFEKYIDSLVTLLITILSYNQEFIASNAPDVKGFFEKLDDLMRLRLDGHEPEGGVRVLDFILSVLKEGHYTTRGEPMKGVQVLGLLEARNLDFDCIIIPSMNEGIFPARSEKDLFINHMLRKECGLPYDKERDSLFKYYFTEMISGKKEVVISYIEEEKRDLRSRFIDLLVDQGVAVDERKIRLDAIGVKRQTRSVEKSSALIKQVRGLLAKRGLSPTSLRDYKECPYRFYLKYLLKIQEPACIVEEPGPAEWGRIVHRALRDLYQYDFPHGLKRGELNKARSKLHRRLSESLSREIAISPKASAKIDLEIYKRNMDKYLAVDAERCAEGFIPQIEFMEQKAEIELDVRDYKIRLFGYPDRVDIKEKRYHIYDYKTTTPAKEKYEIGAEFCEFQLPLYGMAIAKGELGLIGGLAYYEVGRNPHVVPVVEQSDVLSYLEAFRNSILLPTLQEILDPDVPFNHMKDRDGCRYCMYTDMCGVHHD